MIDLTSFGYGLILIIIYLTYVIFYRKHWTNKQGYIAIALFCLNILNSYIVENNKAKPTTITSTLAPMFDENATTVLPANELKTDTFNQQQEQKINDALATKIEIQSKSK